MICKEWVTSGTSGASHLLEPNFRLGQYRIVKRLGGGGGGEVYLALQDTPERLVALKIFRSNLNQQQREQFRLEINRLAKLAHPHIAHVYEGQTYQSDNLDVPYYALEYVEQAKPITDYAAANELSIRQRLELFLDVCSAVQYAHGRDILHCDLKPGNILVDRAGRVKLIDLGISMELRQITESEFSDDAAKFIQGTIPYLSPEQCEGEREHITKACDVYSLGVVLYELLSGDLPYELPLQNPAKAIALIKTEPPQPLRLASGSRHAGIDAIVRKALDKDPESRYASAAAMAKDIERVLDGKAPACAALPQRSLSLVRTGIRQWWLAVAPFSVACAIFLAIVLGSWIEQRGARAAFERILTSRFEYIPSAPFQHLRIVTLSDETNLEELADEQGLSGVSSENLQSARRLHGRLLEKLAQSGARVVSCDLFFSSSSEFDDELVHGIDALRQAGIPFVTGVPTWELNGEGAPVLSDRILPHVTWGGASLSVGGEAPWTAHLLLKRNASAPIPSLVLATIARWYDPGSAWTANFHLQQIELHFLGRGALGTRLVPLTQIEELTDSTPDSGLEVGDAVGHFMVQVPRESHLAQSQIEYAEILRADREKLHALFADKVVLIADFRIGRDGPFPYPDGRMLPGSIAHAAAIEQILLGRTIRATPVARIGELYLDGDWFIAILAGIAGVILARLTLDRPVMRVVAPVVLLLAGFAGMIAAFPAFGVLLAPVMPLAAFTLVVLVLFMLNAARRVRI